MNNEKDIREILESEEVPEELSPENIKRMLDEKASSKKRRKISMAGRITATAAACAVIVGATAGSVHLLRNSDNKTADSSVAGSSVAESSAEEPETAEVTVEQANSAYMNSAESYEQIYNMLEKADKEYKKSFRYSKGFYMDDYVAENSIEDGAIAENSVEANDMETGTGGNTEIPETPVVVPADEFSDEPTTEPATEEFPTESPTEETTEPATEETTEETTESEEESEESEEYSDTYNQEAGVLEADIVKTDGKKIYYLTNTASPEYNDGYYQVPVLNIATVKDGEFLDSTQVNVAPETYTEDGWEEFISVSDMYLYNDLIAVIGTVDAYYEGYEDGYDYPTYFESDMQCFVSFYNQNAELVGTYWQDGNFNDVRISPDGYMYLISTYNSIDFSYIGSCDNIEKYIPECGVDNNTQCLPPEDILLPKNNLDNTSSLGYTIIGSIDLTVQGQFSPVDSKALAGYTGTVYSSADNIYTAMGWEETDITRISVSAGNITPSASCTVEGYVKDQFSMSEYDGYFRVAATVDRWEDNSNFITDFLDIDTSVERIQDNRVYVFDMDLNEVGRVSGFGENETIKSVSFSGNMGYVVTYEQTDPLFAIDLSNPAEPFITDEFKILGYSTYMQNWTDGLLLGFGVDADENGIENGVKLAMFDNSDPYDLKEVGLYAISSDDTRHIYSPAVYERKALLIAPEKNLIAVPVSVYGYDDYGYSEKQLFFEYNNGEFIQKGEISDGTYYDRTLYIGDYVYLVSGGKFVSADIDTITVKDEVYFG